MSTNTLYIDSSTKESTWIEFLFSYIERNSEKEQLFQWKDILTCQLAFIYFSTSCKKPKMSYILLVFRDLALDINKSKTFYLEEIASITEKVQLSTTFFTQEKKFRWNLSSLQFSKLKVSHSFELCFSDRYCNLS